MIRINDYGFINRYANCYYNTTLQIMFRLPPFSDKFRELKEHLNDEKDLEFKNFCIGIQAMAIMTDSANGNQFDATSFLPFLWKTFRMQPHTQHDSSEFYIHFVDLLVEKKIIKEKDIAFEFQQSIQCNKKDCYRHKKTIKETCLHIQNISGHIGNSIQEYIKNVKIPDMKCERCGEKGMEKSLRFINIPHLLSIYIHRTDGKRVLPNNLFFGPFRLKKDTNLNDEIDYKRVYNPVGFIFYSGNGNGGHYMAAIKKDSLWTIYDDTSIKTCSFKELPLSLVLYAFYL